MADQLIEMGKADFVGMGRGSLADPALPNKAKAGNFTDIRYCIGCLQGCTGALYVGGPVTCLVNPCVGREYEADYTPVAEASVMQAYCAKYPELARGIFKGGSDPAAWADEYEQPVFYADDYKSVSAQGEDMRSGGEMYISARLDHYGIPYRYEAETGIPDLNYAPDFTIMRPRDHKIIYWEHFGKVNDYGYVLDNFGKVKDYISYGIKPWDNLIMTFSNEKGGYDGKLIDAMIECWLL